MSICAHELAHLSESKWVLAGRTLGSLAFMPLIFLTPSIHNFSLWGPLALLFLIFLLRRFSRKLSISCEKRADAQATADQTVDGVYARALEKLYEANQLPAVNSKNTRTHPHLYDRLIAAGVTPTYPRPQAARGISWAGRSYALAMGFLLGLTIVRDVHEGTSSKSESPAWLSGAAETIPSRAPNPQHEPSHLP